MLSKFIIYSSFQLSVVKPDQQWWHWPITQDTLNPLNQSAIRKKMAPRVAFWVNRQVGPKFTVPVCMGIWQQIISLDNKFWTIYEQQSYDTRQKTILNKFKGWSCARKHSVAFLIFHTFVYTFFSCQLAGKVWKLKTWLNVFKHSSIPQIWWIQSLT